MPAYLQSELPVRAIARQHWIVLLRRPKQVTAIGLAIGAVLAYLWPWPWLLLLILVGGFLASMRWREWRAERIILTGKRVIHLQGIPETVTSEASLRVDRISGIRYIEPVWGKLWNYANIELEAPGDHPGISRLLRMRKPSHFYLELRQLVFDEQGRPDPDEDGSPAFDDHPQDYLTEPLPVLPPERDRFGRRRY